MKRIVAFVLLLFLLSAGSFCVIGKAVSREKDNVTMTENVIYGDKSRAEGITVLTKATYGEHLFWNTAHTLGETPKVDTEYEFYYSPHYQDGERHYRGLTLELGERLGFDSSIPPDEGVGLQKAYRELYESTAPGKTGTKTVRLQDYYTYYPLGVRVDLPGVMWHGHDYAKLTADTYENERAVWDAFNEFFKIPIPDDLPAFEITLTKDAKGNLSGMSSSGVDISFGHISVYTENRCFFSIDNRYHSKETSASDFLDWSLVPGGYGIYAFDYENVRGDSNSNGNITVFHPGYETGVKEETLAMVFPLEIHAEVVRMTLDRDGKNLLLFTLEHDVTYLTVIDIASMTEVQKLKVTESTKYSFYENDTCIVLSGWEDLTVIEKKADGDYSVAFTVPRMKEVNGIDGQKGVATAIDFDGERLVMVDRTGDQIYPSLPLCGFTVAIYDKTGLVYYAEYESSLSSVTDPHDYAFNCLPVEHTVRFEE